MILLAALSFILIPKLLVLGGWVLAAIYIQRRGRVRFRFLRQLTDHSTFMAPYNALMYLTSAVPQDPILEARDFPQVNPLRENWETLRDEALALLKTGQIKRSEHYDDLAFNSFFRRGWKRFYLKWYGGIFPSARILCPRSAALIENIPAIRAAMFALLAPHSRLVKHRDPYAGSLRYHLGLSTPDSALCRIFIDGIPYHWRNGQDIVFDQTYLHVAENQTEEPRIILFCDLERPLTGRIPNAINRLVSRHLMQSTTTANVKGERIGLCNQAFGCLYRIRLAGKRLKRLNRRCYYAVKYLLFLGAFYLIFF